MLYKKNYFKIYFTIIIILIIIFAGCSQRKKQEPKSSPNKLPPNTLLNINSTSDKIIDDLEKIYSKLVESKEDDKKNNKEGSKKSNKKQKSQQQDKKSKEQKEEQKNQEYTKKQMKKIESNIKKLHQDWNKYESRQAISSKQVKAIEQALNNFTETINTKKVVESLVTISQFKIEIADLYKSHDVKYMTQLKKIESYTRKIMYLSMLVTEEKVDHKQQAILKKVKRSLSKVQNKFESNQELNPLIKELSNSIFDLEQAIKKQELEVIKVKSNLILNKVKKIEESK